MFKLAYTPTPDGTKYISLPSGGNLVKLAVSQNSEYRIPELTPVSNQGSLGSCVSNSCADAAEILLGLERKEIVQLSRLFIYWNARMYTKDTDKDHGCFIHNAFDSLSRLGVCPESEWQYDESKVFVRPSLRAYKTANDNKINQYYRIDSTGDQRCADVESAIRSNHPVVFGTQVSKEYTSAFGADKVWGIPQNTIGGHAQIIVGVRRNPNLEFLIRNSWGTDWGTPGIPGHVWYSSEYISWEETSDLWVPTMVDDII